MQSPRECVCEFAAVLYRSSCARNIFLCSKIRDRAACQLSSRSCTVRLEDAHRTCGGRTEQNSEHIRAQNIGGRTKYISVNLQNYVRRHRTHLGIKTSPHPLTHHTISTLALESGSLIPRCSLCLDYLYSPLPFLRPAPCT